MQLRRRRGRVPGFKFTRDGITATDSKIKAISGLAPPTTNKHLYSFLCLVNYNRTLIPNFGELTYALYDMARSAKKACEWSDNTFKCFEALKRALISAPILAYPDFSKPFQVHSDSSDWAIAAVLLQLHERLLKPIAFASRRLTSTEHNYTTSERELLAITYAYDQFYAYIYGRHILFYTDHEPLVTMRQLKFVNMEHKRLARLFHRLQDVDYELRHIAGAENYLADFLSRAFAKEELAAEANHLMLKSVVDWTVEQAKDSELCDVMRLLRSDASDAVWLALVNGRRWLNERRHLFISPADVLMHSKNRIVCPSNMYADVLLLHHDSPLAGHRAFETTFESVKTRFFWLFMSSFVKNYCKSCNKCQSFNYACLHPRAPLQPIVVSRPWQLVGTDFMGPFRTSKRGKTYIILAVDHFTKFAEGAATSSFDAITTAHFIQQRRMPLRHARATVVRPGHQF